ncbi:DUF4870 domain-containing protein [Marixanthomonas sp. SCSIO 43207]|uniref:DUF4870 domain-containing protein n=1 Tax=Marixanthomonas sp. SCSIO 43207 TaxID=2779360 RepID=UPI001CA87E15|nr:DUF4870 domain-containing protein [Marixanthomonas sp. SCSIO 43207]UAB80281.1 DUF4870 domain-containing protein [Marixanthomonas sp. SCSIO 43207]
MATTISNLSKKEAENQKNIAAGIHLTTFLKYFFPFANFIAPLILWVIHKEKPFVDANGKQAINFQLSVLLYSIGIGLLCLPFFVLFASDFISLVEAMESNIGNPSFYDLRNLSGYIILFGIAGLLLFGLFILELYAVITATMYAAKGKLYNYPLCIPFLKPSSEIVSEINQSKNEHTS